MVTRGEQGKRKSVHIYEQAAAVSVREKGVSAREGDELHCAL